MGFFGCIPRFLKAHGGWVLTGLGSLGLIGTVILVGKETSAAQKAVQDASDEKWAGTLHRYSTEEDGSFCVTGEWYEEHKEELELTFLERAKASLPIYVPAILTGAGTLACFWGAQIFNAKKQAALVAAYSAMALQFDQYREAIKAEHGEEADRKAFEISQMEVRRLREEIKRLKEENGPFLYGIATLPGVVFEAKPVDIQEALMHFNRNLVLGGENDLDQLYRFIGIPESCYNEDDACSYGWNQYENEVDWGIGYADFGMESVVAKNGRMVHIIKMAVPPYRIDGWEEDSSLSSADRTYEGYNLKRAKELAESICEKNQLTRIHHEPITACCEYLTD